MRERREEEEIAGKGRAEKGREEKESEERKRERRKKREKISERGQEKTD